jgi:hypothetical protein
MKILSSYLSIYGCTALEDLGHFLFSFLIYIQSVGLFGWGISPSQATTDTEQHSHKINSHRHP